MYLRYHGNSHDPRHLDSSQYVVRDMTYNETHEQAVRRHDEWIRQLLIGEPQGVEGGYSYDQLKECQFVGLYSIVTDECGIKDAEVRNYHDWLMCWSNPGGGGRWIDHHHPHQTGCKHEFVARDPQGKNRFLCRQCYDRFPRHPDLMIFGLPSICYAC